jgi:carbon-monoxide dehydrogenase large subunit
MLHLVFVRSPHAHARIVSIDSEAAKRAPGVALVATGAEVAAQCKPFITDGGAQNRPGHKVPPQHVMAVDVAHYQGQPVAAVAAETRAQAEDAAERIEIAWEPLPAVLDGESALAASPLHKELPRTSPTSISRPASLDAAFASARHVIEETFRFHLARPPSLEPRD